MPKYTYQCQNESCKEEFDVQHSMFSDALKQCPYCLHDTLIRLINTPHVYCRPSSDSCSLGLLADRNTAAFSDDQKADLARKHKTKKKIADGYELPKGMKFMDRKD